MKRVALLICITAVAALCLGMFPACSSESEYYDTFTGYLSTETFYSQDAAAKGFFQTELGTRNYQYINYLPIEQLSSAELSELELPDEVISAQKVSINYMTSSHKESASAAYIIKTSAGYKYFAPLPESGEPVTASYYNSVLSNKAYENCTVNTTYNVHLFSIDSSYYQVFAFDYDKAYFKQTLPAMQVDFYMEESNEGFKYYSKLTEPGKDGYYQQNYGNYALLKGGKTYPLDSFENISELSTFIYAANFDFSYFEKTDYGFCMPRDKFMSAIHELIGEFGDTTEDIELQINEHYQNLDVKYYVQDGRLAKIDTIVQGILTDDPKDIFSIESHSVFEKFSTTEITIPKGDDV